jgi:hypothetical protein
MRRGRSLPAFPDQAEQQIGGSFGLGMAARNPKHLMPIQDLCRFSCQTDQEIDGQYLS